MHEINLLPPSKRKRLRQMWLYDGLSRFLKHTQVVLITVTALGIITGAILQASLIVLPADGEAEVLRLIAQYQQIRHDITEENKLIEEIQQLTENRIIWSDYVLAILQVLPPGTTIQQISGRTSPDEISFAGTSVNRNALIILQGRLQELSWAKDVSSPLQNLLSRDNPSYSFTVSIEPAAEQP
jgi:Tfp pilus assembly protein PilN